MTCRLTLAITASLVTALWTMTGATAAAAQCRLCTQPTTGAEPDAAPPVKLEIETRLDFDRLVLGNSGGGSATLSPDGTRRTSGAVLSIGGRAMVGTVMVRGEPGRSVRIGLPGTIILFSPTGSEIRIDAIRSDLPDSPRIGLNGTLGFRFGGELQVTGDADGNFRGDFQIDVDYL